MVYILQFVPPFKHAQYYIGYCDDERFEERLAEHHNGHGATIVRRALEAGHRVQPLITLPGTRQDERRLKNQHNTPRIVHQILSDEHCI